MKHQVPEWKVTTTTATTEEGGSQNCRYEDFGLPPDFVVPQTDHIDHTPWNIDSSSGPTTRDENFQEIFGNLSNIHKGFLSELDNKDQSSGRKTTAANNMEIESVFGESKQKPDERRLKRARAAELHNMSERKRRNRIRGKMKALAQLIPNCNKSDRASTLDDAIKYIKALQLQVQMMSVSGGALYPASNLSMAGIPSLQIPQIMSYVPVGMGMGMVNMPCYSTSTGLPIMPVPSANLHPFQLATAGGLPLMSGPGVLPANNPDQLRMRIPMPSLASQAMPADTSATPNMVQPQFAADNQRVPTLSQKYNVLPSRIVTPNFDRSAGCDHSRQRKTITKLSSMQSFSESLQLRNN